MINEFLNMNGYGQYVWPAFLFTHLSLISLYLIIKIQYVKEKNKFIKCDTCILYSKGKNLVIETETYFPNSKVVFIQQQIPGCRFVNPNFVYHRFSKFTNIFGSKILLFREDMIM